MDKPLLHTYEVKLRPGRTSPDSGAALGSWIHAPSAAAARADFLSRFPACGIDFSESGSFTCRLRHRGIRDYVQPRDSELRAYEGRVVRAQRRLITRRFGPQAGSTANYFWVSELESACEPSCHLTKISRWATGQDPIVLKTIGRVGRRLRHSWRELK